VRRTWKDEPDFKNQQEDEPALNVSWNDAMTLCHWLGRKEGRRYRLPTEAEWEFAARAGSAGRWCFGDDRGRLGEYAWYEGNSGGRPHAVGTKKPNAFGLFDMHGNMFEYAADFFADTDFEQRFGPKPPIAVDPTGIPWGTRTCLRGGSFDTNSYFQRATSRLGGATRYQYIYHMGCRLVMVLGDDGPSEPVNISLAGRRGRNAHPAAQPPKRLVKHESNPVLEIASDGAECRKSFSITRMDDVWYLWHAAKPPAIERVVSVDGIHWTTPTAKPVRGLGALFNRGLPLQWDDREIAMPYALKVTDHMPRVLQMGRSLHLWYLGSDGQTTRLGLATSTDGTHWTKSAANPILDVGNKDAWDSGSILAHDAQWHDGRFHIWYSAAKGNSEADSTIRIGYALSASTTTEEMLECN